ncbi:MAG: ABC transporter ATP-binding protein, partial [Thermoleophilia bacterium]|nr:ABC transporter ATP-binding protein [Thermoleophilia bacterium]
GEPRQAPPQFAMVLLILRCIEAAGPASPMGDQAVRVEQLSKRYRIVKAAAQGNGQPRTFGWRSSPFAYIAGSLRAHGDEEILWALKDVSFEVAHGEVIGIIGRNGAGKSTLLKVLSRITEPTSGRALLHGRVGSLLEVGTGFHPELTGRENIFVSGAILGMRRSEVARKFDEIIAFAEVDRFLDTPVKRYSSGMYVRLAFAVAAHLETEILLMDEVLAVGDAAFQRKCLGKMGDVATQGRTVIFVSHNMVAVQSLCPRSVWLDGGSIVDEGESRGVISSYLAASRNEVSDRVWLEPAAAPGNEKVRIRRVCVRPQEGGSRDSMTMETPLAVEIEYWNIDPGTPLQVSLRFLTDEQVVAFSTAANEDSPLDQNGNTAKGLYRSVCYIPGDLLNEGTYRMMLLIVRDAGKVIFRMEDALSFEILNVGKRPGYRYGGEPGAVRPKLTWGTEYLRGV